MSRDYDLVLICGVFLARSCYALSGLSVAQFSSPHIADGTSDQKPIVYGDSRNNAVAKVSCVFNVRCAKLLSAMQYYSEQPGSHDQLCELGK